MTATRTPFCTLWPCDLDAFWSNINWWTRTRDDSLQMVPQPQRLSIPAPSLVILVWAVLVLSCTHTDRISIHTDAAQRLTHATVVGVSNNTFYNPYWKYLSRNPHTTLVLSRWDCSKMFNSQQLHQIVLSRICKCIIQNCKVSFITCA